MSANSNTSVAPIMETAAAAVLLSFVSGCINSFAFMNDGLFSTVMSGNVLSASMSLANGHWGRGLSALGVILCFFAGATLGGLFIGVMRQKGRHFTPILLTLEALVVGGVALIWGLGILPTSPVGAHVACMMLAVAAGAQGTAYHKEDRMLYGNVAVTAVVQGFAGFLSQLLLSKTPEKRAYYRHWLRRFGFDILAFGGGAAFGAVLGRVLGSPHPSFEGTPVAATAWVLIVPAIVFAVGAVATAVFAHHGRSVDPASGSGLIY